MAEYTHKVEIVPVVMEPHPNADSLSVVRVYGFTVVVRTADWENVPFGAYIQPDSVVDTTRPEFAFLGDNSRIRVKKLRGVISMGLLVPAPDGCQVGDDVAGYFGITHYEPKISAISGGETEEPPPGVYAPKYDVESMYRFVHCFNEGEMVEAREKIHGMSSKFVFAWGRMWAGSRNEWKKYDSANVVWKALEQNPWITDFCKANPGLVVYGEIYGNVQSLKYGCGQNEYRVAVFDVMRGTEWMSCDELQELELNKELKFAPFVYHGFFHFETLQAFAEGQSLIPGANHIREGIVVRPVVERQDLELGRVQLKLVSNTYLEKGK